MRYGFTITNPPIAWLWEVSLQSITTGIFPNQIKVAKVVPIFKTERYHITFNTKESKLICYNVDPNMLDPICLNKHTISVVDNDKHIGNYIYHYIYDKNIVSSICDLHERNNSIISDFNACNSDTLNRVYSSFCMHMYGCELWKLSSSYSDKYLIAWRKIKRRTWKIPSNSHKHIVHNLSSDCKCLVERRILKFLHNGLNIVSVYIKNWFKLNLHVKIAVLLIIIHYWHTNITLAILTGQII